MKKRRKGKSLLDQTEKFAILLLSEATGGTLGKSEPQNTVEGGMQFSDKRALLDSFVRLLAIKHRIDPEQEENEFMSMREELSGASRETKNRANGFGSTPTSPADES